jgi:hypothetical protein
MSRAATVAIIGGTILAMPAASSAEDLGTGRRVQHTTKLESVEVGDVDGHVVGVVEFKGLTFFANGEIANHVNTATFDLVDGTGPHQGYVVHYFQDGSKSFERYQGRALIQDGGRKTVVEGSFECAGGTGRFGDLNGSGTYRGERLGGLELGDVYIDFTGSCRVP